MRAKATIALLVSAIAAPPAATGCTKRETLAILAEPGDLVIVAVVSGSEVRRVVHSIAPEPAPSFSLGEDEAALAFVIAEGELLGEDGRALASGFTIGKAGDDQLAGGACRRCLAPTDRPPLILHDGARCPIPAFAATSGEASEERRARIRAGIAIASSAACGCEPYRPPPGDQPNLQLELLYPPVFEPLEKVAASTDRAVATFSERESRRFPTERGDAVIAGSLFAGPVMAAAGLSGGRYAVASHDPSATTRDARLDIFDAELQRIGAIEDLPVRPNGLRYFPEDDLFTVFGTGFPRVVRALTCTATTAPAPVDCRAITDDMTTGVGEQTFDALRMPSGLFVLATQFGYIFYERLPRAELISAPARIISSDVDESIGLIEEAGRPIRWRSISPKLLDDSGREQTPIDLRLLGHAGDRLYACGQDPESAVLVTADLDRAIVEPATPIPNFRVVHREPSAGCGGFTSVPGAPEQIRLSFTTGRAVIAGASGALITPAAPYYLPGTAMRLAPLIDTPAAGVSVATSFGGALFRRDDRTGNDQWTQLIGPPEFEESAIASIVARGEQLFAFRRNGEVIILDGRPTSVERISGLAADLQVVAVTRDTENDGFLVAGFDLRARTPALARAGADLRLTPIALDGGPDLSDTAIFGLAETAPGTFVMIAEDTRVLRLRGDTLDEVRIEWDDPYTPMIEAMPEYSTECPIGQYRGARPRQDFLRSVDAGRGVTWIVGCAGVILRVIAFGDTAIAERVYLGRATQAQHAPESGMPPLGAVKMWCPDDLAFGSTGGDATNREQGRVWRIATDPRSSVDPVFGTLALIDAEGNLNARRSTELDSGQVYALLLSRDRLVVVMGAGYHSRGSVHVAGARSRQRFADDFRVAAEDSRGRMVIGTRHGRLVGAIAGVP